MKYRKRNKGMTVTEAHLNAMGLSSTQDINNWYIKSRQGQYWIKGIDRFLEIVSLFYQKYIYVFGDYDVDGVCGTSILLWGLHRAGCKNIRYRIPHRFSEGFGLNQVMVDEIKEDPKDVLIVTVDNGIAALDAIAYAKSKGFTVIVTDHHKPFVNDKGNIEYPVADLIINPNAIPNSADFSGYCGAGIAYKITQALLKGDNFISYLQPLAALATICDQMKLEEENYVIVREGLLKLNKGCALPGMLVLGETMRNPKQTDFFWTSDFMGYKAGPCINAPERMQDGGAAYGVELMTHTDINQCRNIAQQMKILNEYRIKAVEDAMEMVDEILEKRGDNPGYPVLLYVPNVSEGIIGILAGKVEERYGYPAGVFSDSKEGILKGSFRGPEDYNVKAHLDMVASEFIGYGGHEGAGAGSVKKSNFEHMCQALQGVSVKPAVKEDEEDVFYYDVEINDRDVASAIKENLAFAPFGNGNPDLVFKVTGFDVTPDPKFGDYKKQIGGNGIRLKSPFTTAVGFGLWDELSDINGACRITLYGAIDDNLFNGKHYPQVKFAHCEIETQSQTPLAQKLADQAKNRYK